MRRFMAALAALILSLTLAGPALAVSGSASTSESLTVIAAAFVSVTGLPTSVSLGSAVQGTTTDPVTIGTADIGTNVASWSVSLSQSALSGPGTIAAGNSQWAFDTGGGFGGFASYPLGGPILTSADGPMSIGIRTQWAIPANAPAGAYSGTLTVTATGS